MDQRHPCSLIALWDLCEVGVRSNLRCTPGPIQSVKQTHLTIFLCLLHDYAHDIVALLGGLAECKEGKKKDKHVVFALLHHYSSFRKFCSWALRTFCSSLKNENK